MVTSITNFKILRADGEKIREVGHGNNVAFECFNSDGLVLIARIGMKNWRGRDAEHPVACKGCGAKYFLEILKDEEKLYIHRLA